MSKPAPPVRKTVTDDIVAKAIEIRSSGGTWSDVIEATGFNGAILRPHMAKAGFNPQQVTKPVKLTPASIAAARKAGMPWYALSLALDTPEAKLRALAAEADKDALKRTYLSKPKPAPKAKSKAKAKAKAAKKSAPKPAKE